VPTCPFQDPRCCNLLNNSYIMHKPDKQSMLTNLGEILNSKKVMLCDFKIHTPLTAGPASKLKPKWIPLHHD
jgi:hypothetical protein